MGSRFLTDLADVVRRAGLTAVEVGSSPSTTGTAWQSRARSSGGYGSGLPNHVMVHHTASGASADGWGDANYCTFSSSNRPVANLLLARDGRVWVMAAGATNTNGQGSDPCRVTPNDSMNSQAIGIEAGNNGTGEPWPDAQQRAYTTLVRALCDAYGIPNGRIHSHAEWAPGRKIDPAGPSRWASSGTWPMNPFRADVAAGWPGGTTPPRPTRRWLAMYGIYITEDGAQWASDMMTVRWLRTGRASEHYRAMLTAFGFNPNPETVPQQELLDGVYGLPVGDRPWGGTFDGERAWAYPVQATDWPLGAAWQYLVDGRVSANSAAVYAQQAAQNTMPAGRSLTEPSPPDKLPD